MTAKMFYCLLLLLIMYQGIAAQTDSFSVFRYQPPAYFTRTPLSSSVRYTLKNSDTSNCNITLYKSITSKENHMKELNREWNEYVVKRLSKANDKPLQTHTNKTLDGWNYILAIGNFYQNKKKCVVMLQSFKKDNQYGWVVIELSDRIFQPVVEQFSNNLHLKN